MLKFRKYAIQNENKTQVESDQLEKTLVSIFKFSVTPRWIGLNVVGWVGVSMSSVPKLGWSITTSVGRL